MGLVLFVRFDTKVSHAFFFFLRLIWIKEIELGLPGVLLLRVVGVPTPFLLRGVLGKVLGRVLGRFFGFLLLVAGRSLRDWGPPPAPRQVLRPVWGRTAIGGRP